MRRFYRSAGAGALLLMVLCVSCVSGPRFDDTEIADRVRVEQRREHVLITTGTQERATGVVFYPGGLVAEEAYLPLLDDLALAGYRVLVVGMPLGLAVFAPMRGVDLRDEYPDVTRWIIAGHSLGGAMAARAVYRDPGAFDGLVLLASYPPNRNDLSQRTIPVLSIYGERDGLATPEEILSSAALLPESATMVEIVGGNHAQFGSYGPQDGDNDATIPRDVQQRLTVRAILQLLESVAQNGMP